MPFSAHNSYIFMTECVYMSPVQWIIRLRDDEQSIHSFQDLPHGDVSVVVPVEYVVADAANAVDIAVVHLSLC